MSAMNDLLAGAKQTNAPLYATLQATKMAFIRRFNFDTFPLVTNDDYKGAVKKDRNTMDSDSTYQYWRVTSIALDRERGNLKTMVNHGTAMAGAASNTAFGIGYFFPCYMDCTLKYSTPSVQEQLSFIERWLILVGSERLNVKVHLPIGQDGIDFTNRIFLEDSSVPFPDSQIDDESSPGKFSNELSFRVQGFIGTHKLVPKFNNEGTITYETTIEGETLHDE